MIALIESKSIKVAKYALFGSKELSKNIIKAMKNSKRLFNIKSWSSNCRNSIAEAYELAQES